MTLDDELRALKEEEGRRRMPAQLEARVLAAFDDHDATTLRFQQRQQQRQQRSQQRTQRRFAAFALAAGVVLGVGATAVYFQRQPGTPTIAVGQLGESVVLFLDPPAVDEAVRLVRIRVSRAALESLGIQAVASVNPDGAASDSVDVDVLVGEDGVARGVRLAM